MSISEGDTIPDATLVRMGDDGPEQVAMAELTKGRKVVIFGLPGAFTGTCTTAHVPSFMRVRDQLSDKGIDDVICVAVNDPFVMKAWSDATGADVAGIKMLGDPGAEFTKGVGMDFTAPPVGFYDRSQRYAMVVEDGKVTLLHAEENPGVCETSGGEAILAAL
ncbi:peroxiredoxin [Maribius pontilimi]|uniref:Glutathione-dependent peroxiredoxin n=1 Tax=Palleronia pontilimi TaxID=1964209 RepID=A0A934MCU8_9RHOB|nr:peroxiredoxin [Palleronia pontilimi]MBJ3761656.1 peroxiredoxin [Palleronia pontilimi]